MPITMKLGELVNAKAPLERLIAMKFSIVTSYRLARRLKQVNEELAIFETKRNELVKDLGEVMKDDPTKLQIIQVLPATVVRAKAEAVEKRAAFERAKALFEAAPEGVATGKSELQAAMLKAEEAALAAEADVPVKEAGQKKWEEFATKHNELQLMEITLDFDPIPLSDLKTPEDKICSECKRGPNEIPVEDMMLLLPLLSEA